MAPPIHLGAWSCATHHTQAGGISHSGTICARDVIFEQVQQRVREHRGPELAVLPIAAAAGMFGARIERFPLLEAAGLTEAEFAAAFLRLRNEHLVGAEEGGAIRGLHDLRSREIFRACCEALSLDKARAVTLAFKCVVSVDARWFATRAVRDGMMTNAALLEASVALLNRGPESCFLIGMLESLRLQDTTPPGPVS